ncbi:MAG TPA: hypothetical protein VEX13_15415 [Chloroflexia bacterium]|nr:hypothetical protein [Chloroflexia bacterium]
MGRPAPVMRLELRERDAPVQHLWSGWLALVSRVGRERALWLALGLGVLALLAGYQRSLFVDIGKDTDTLYASGFHEPEESGGAGFRWSMANSSIVLPGVGKPLSPFAVKLQLSSGPRPGPVQVRVAVNGHDTPPLTLTQQSAAYSVNVDPSWIDASGDLRLDFTASTFRPAGDRRDLGFIIDFARIETPTGATLPSLTQLFWLLLAGALFYLALRAAWFAPVPAGILTFLLLLGCAGALAAQRLLVTLYSGRLAFTLALAVLAALLIESLTRLVVRGAGWRGERALPEWVWAGLRGLVLVTVALKVGGLLHPYSFVIDAPFHIRYVTYMAEGKPWEQYFGESLALSVMPKQEWGAARAFIPYSPFFFVVAAPLAWLPVPLSLSLPVASGLFEAMKTALVFLVGLALGRQGIGGERTPGKSGRLAVATAGIYASIPATFLLQQWGNWPTQTSLWLLTLWVAIVALFWKRLTSPLVWGAATVVLTLTLLAYTVTAAYTGIFVGLLVVAGWIWAPAERKKWAALVLMMALAVVLALLIYYGQYVGRILGDTLPTFGSAIEEQGSLTTLRPTFWDFVTDHLASAMQSYHLAIIYALGMAGTLLFFWSGNIRSKSAGGNKVYALVARRATRVAGSVGWQHVWLGAWLATFPIFTLADFWVDQAFKQFWFALPAVALMSSGWLLALYARAASSRLFSILAGLLIATLAWQSISLWVFRLFFHNR